MTAPKVDKETQEQIVNGFSTQNIYGKLSKIQIELKAPKNQYNSFGKYNYRNCEDILESVKPICAKYKTTLVIYDEVVMIGDRYYIKAIAKLYDQETEDYIEAFAYARESITKKGMDDSQVTGATSSYARKYALNGLFNIDDTKDFDDERTQQQSKQNKQEQKQNKQESKQNKNNILNHDVIVEEVKKLMNRCSQLGIDLFNNESVVSTIDKHNNGNHDPNTMNDEELTQYANVLKQLIQIREAKK